MKWVRGADYDGLDMRLGSGHCMMNAMMIWAWTVLHGTLFWLFMGILRRFTDPHHCALKLGIIFILVLALTVKLTET